jgi:flap endonuclease-1
MGIYKLMSLIQEKAPNAIKQLPIQSFTGRSIACDASMSIYQFMISTMNIKEGMGLQELKDKEGNPTG